MGNYVKSSRECNTQGLKSKTTRGALYSMGAQGVVFGLRLVSLMALSRLLETDDFGVVNMAAVVTGFLGLFRDAGLSLAVVQRDSVTDAQAATLFWLNLAVGGILAVLVAAVAPLLVMFYGDARLLWITIALGTSFIFGAAGAQHRALLQRDLRFGTLAIIDVGSLALSTTAGIVAAASGLGLWALVVAAVCQPAFTTVAVWAVAQWIPGRPARGTGVGAMVRFGSMVSLNNLVFYLAYNVDKVLLGRFWGAEVLGIYGRAYQLVNLPTENLNSTIGAVAFPALSRIQTDAARVRSYFLKGYSLYLSLVVPIAAACAFYADDIVLVFLGPKWSDAAPLFRLLTPVIFVFALTNPLAWLMLAQGQAGRNLKIAFLVAPVVVLAYVIGLKDGARGMAASFSSAMLLLAGPIIVWAKHGTLVSNRDMVKTIGVPVLSIVVGVLAAWGAHGWVSGLPSALVRLMAGCTVLFGTYLMVLLFVMKQRAVYLDLLATTGLWPIGARNRAARADEGAA